MIWTGNYHSRKRQTAELETAEVKMLRFSLEVMMQNGSRKDYISRTKKVGRFGRKVREARLRWFGTVLRRDVQDIGRRILRMGLPGKRKEEDQKEGSWM